ncbi:hypothetical protein GOP47_0010561 [Adiantum capillus-veneris]|uniref:Uncharacterized protein n=1 Tax=Adiantum capillus-veneris TaxID=13818 RepID=A0A9D4UVI1_ADICA|nr:hypothetical protein GOP47_0010561 [Adiantum capillus-veneris]
MEIMHEEANGLTVRNMYNIVYEDALDLNSQQEGGQGLVSREMYVQPVARKSENASVEEFMSFCDEENVCEEVVQIEGLFDGVVDDMKFFYGLMPEARDGISFISSFDTRCCRFWEVSCY